MLAVAIYTFLTVGGAVGSVLPLASYAVLYYVAITSDVASVAVLTALTLTILADLAVCGAVGSILPCAVGAGLYYVSVTLNVAIVASTCFTLAGVFVAGLACRAVVRAGSTASVIAAAFSGAYGRTLAGAVRGIAIKIRSFCRTISCRGAFLAIITAAAVGQHQR